MPARRRLAILTPVFPPARGGIETLTHRLALALPGYEPFVVAGHAPGEPPALPFRVRRVANDPPGGRKAILRLNAAAAADLARSRPDAVLCMHVRAGVAACAHAAAFRTPFVQYVHAKEVLESPQTARFVLSRARGVIAVSAFARELAEAAGAAAERCVVVPNGIDAAPPPTVPKAARPTLVTVSRLADRYKGHDVLLRALPGILARVPDARWVVVGDGPLRAGLERDAAALGVAGAVEFAGAVDDGERDRLLDEAWAFAMLSRPPAAGRAGEGFGIVFLEASARGLPVVAGRTPGVVDAVSGEEGGILVDPLDADAAADAIAGLLADPARASRIGAAGRERSRRFSWELVGARVAGVLDGISGDRPVHGARSRNHLGLARELLAGPVAP